MVGAPQFANSRAGAIWALSEDGSHAAVARADGGVDVFDLSAGGRVSDRFGASSGSTSRPATLAISQKRGRSSFTVATGSASGDVFLSGEPVCNLAGRICGIAFSESALFAAGGAEKQVIRLDAGTKKILQRYSVAKEHRSALSSFAVSSNAKTMAACSQTISLLDVETGKSLRSFSGHPSPITSSAFFADDTRLVTGSKEDDFLQVWDTTDRSSEVALSASKKKKRKRNSSMPLHTLLAPESGVRSIAVGSNGDEKYSVAALLKSGSVAVWSQWAPDAKRKAPKSNCVIHPVEPDSDAAAPPVYSVGFSSDGRLFVVFGNSLKPDVYWADEHAEQESLFLPKAASENLLVSKHAPLRSGQVPGLEGGVADRAVAEGSAPEAINASATEHARGSPKKRGKKKKVSPANGAGGVGTDSEKEGESAQESEGEDADNEPTIRERLSALGVNDAGSKSASMEDQDKSGKSLDSRAEVIMQAVSSKDSKLLDSVLYQRYTSVVVGATVRQLPVNVATDTLLSVLVERLKQKSRRAPEIMPWIQAVISEHAGALISQPKSRAMYELRDTVTKRNQTLDALNRLEGRLGLVVAQADRAAKCRKEGMWMTTPQVEYVERVRKEGKDVEMDSSDEDDSGDEEDVASHSSSDEDSGEEEGMDVVGAKGGRKSSKGKPASNGHKPAADDMDSASESE